MTAGPIIISLQRQGLQSPLVQEFFGIGDIFRNDGDIGETGHENDTDGIVDLSHIGGTEKLLLPLQFVPFLWFPVEDQLDSHPNGCPKGVRLGGDGTFVQKLPGILPSYLWRFPAFSVIFCSPNTACSLFSE